MKTARVVNITRNIIVADKAEIADSFFSRCKGLLGRNALNEKEGIIIKPCSSIHTFFMRFPIDAAFINKHERVIRIYSSLRPGRLSAIVYGSVMCIELAAGALALSRTEEGDILRIF